MLGLIHSVLQPIPDDFTTKYTNGIRKQVNRLTQICNILQHTGTNHIGIIIAVGY